MHNLYIENKVKGTLTYVPLNLPILPSKSTDLIFCRSTTNFEYFQLGKTYL